MLGEGRAGLSPADRAALDEILSGGWAPASNERGARMADLLGLLGGTPWADAGDRGTLIDVTMARVLRAGVVDGERAIEAALVPDDQEALDAWVLGGYDLSRAPGSLRGRLEAHQALMQALTAVPPSNERAVLVDRTVARVDAWRRNEGRRLPIEPVPAYRRIRWRELATVAAMVMVGTSVVWPMVSAVRHAAQRTACLGHFNTVASAMGAYAGDWRGSMPVAVTEMAGLPWWAVQPGKPVANSANLFTLPRTGYAKLQDLACGGNSTACRKKETPPNAWDWGSLDEVSYSYQIMFTSDRPGWEGEGGKAGRMAVLTDRSPVVLRAVRGEWVYPLENSPNHAGRGQNILFTDGSAGWYDRPVVGQDNIWLPAFIEAAIRRALESDEWVREQPLRGIELPQGHDVFVGP
ncbi:MAG: hypothetical protein FJ255_02540 [Phycisphaerae bacterium]|nr:hypothetical protein [Phycisphaerae bacterium]